MTVDIIDIFNNQIRAGYSFCYICLRTEQETRIVQPNFARNLAGIFSRNIFNDVKKKTVCYLCEQAARHACNLNQAFSNAMELKHLIRSLNKVPAGEPVSSFLAKHANEYSMRLEKFRSRYNLKQTEVLVVDSIGIKNASEMSANSSQRVNTENMVFPPFLPDNETVVIDDDDDVQIVQEVQMNPLDDRAIEEQEKAIEELWRSQEQSRDAATKQRKNHPRQQEQTYGTEVVIGEITNITNPDSNKIPPKMVSIDKFLKIKGDYLAARMPGDSKIIVRSPEDTENCIIHNIVHLNNKEYIPTLSCEIIKDSLVYTPTVFQSAPLIELRPITSQDRRDVVDSNVVILPKPSKGTQIVNVRNGNTDVTDVEGILESYLTNMKTQNKSNSDSVKRKQKVSNSDVPSNKKVCATETVSDFSDVNGPIAVISNVKSITVEEHDVEEIPDVVVEKKPEERSGKTDWEDKIPMDIISFVEPDADMLILPH